MMRTDRQGLLLMIPSDSVYDFYFNHNISEKFRLNAHHFSNKVPMHLYYIYIPISTEISLAALTLQGVVFGTHSILMCAICFVVAIKFEG